MIRTHDDIFIYVFSSFSKIFSIIFLNGSDESHKNGYVIILSDIFNLKKVKLWILSY